MYARTGLVIALLIGSLGCSKKSAASYADYYEYDEYGDYGGEAAMEADAAMPMEEPAADFGRRDRRMARRAEREMSPGAAAPSAPPSPGPVATGGDDGGGDTAEQAPTDDEQADHGRHIIYTATMQVSVFNLEDAMTRAESLPGKYGGYVQNMSAGYFVMRIPSANLRPAMEELSGLGVVDSRTLDAQDVTEEFLDIETRIAVLESTQKQMMELLTKARTVEEALKVRQALDQITMELEVLKGRLRRLESLISFSTLTLSIVERGPHSTMPSSNDPFPWVDELGVEATEWK